MEKKFSSFADLALLDPPVPLLPDKLKKTRIKRNVCHVLNGPGTSGLTKINQHPHFYSQVQQSPKARLNIYIDYSSEHLNYW